MTDEISKQLKNWPVLALLVALSGGGGLAGGLVGMSREDVTAAVTEAVQPLADSVEKIQDDVSALTVDMAVIKDHDKERTERDRDDYRRRGSSGSPSVVSRAD